LEDNFSVIDLDHEIEKIEGKTINQIFETQGEDYFRDTEAATLRKLTNKLLFEEIKFFESQNTKVSFTIISCGGGTPCFRDNMEWMNEKGLTIWINPTAEVLVSRLEGEKAKRPLIKNLHHDEIKSFVTQKLLDRAIFYKQSKITIEDSTLSTENFLKIIKHA
jgi:shikimate kinase